METVKRLYDPPQDAGIAAVIAFALQVYANTLEPINKNQGDISSENPTHLTPASAAFGIWGFIYMLQMLFVLRHALPKKNRFYAIVTPLQLLYIGTCVFNGLWCVLWNSYKLGLSLLCMVPLWLLTMAGWMYLNVQHKFSYARAPCPWFDFLVIHALWSIYAGWITGAMILNVLAALYHAGTVVPAGASNVILVAFGVFGSVVLWTTFDLLFPLTVVWTSYFIRVKNLTAPTRQLANASVARCAGTVALVVLLQVVVAGVGFVYTASVKRKR